MASVNKVIMIGNLTRDPELRYTPAGTAICEFAVALNRNWTTKEGEKREEVAFIEVTAWARQAEVCKEFLRKGRPVFVEGYLKQDRWEDKNTGQKRSKVSVTAERIQFLGGGPPRAESESAPPPPSDEDAPPPVDEEVGF